MRAPDRTQIIVAVTAGVAVGGLAAWLASKMMGGGHGTYVPAILLFPYSMAIATALGSISVPLIVLALVQYPLYGFVAASATTNASTRRRIVLLLLIHVSTAAVAFGLGYLTRSAFG